MSRVGLSPGRWRLGVLQTSLDILGPVAYVLVRVEHQIRRAGHVVLPLTLAHVVVRAVTFVRMVAYVAVLFFARHLVG